MCDRDSNPSREENFQDFNSTNVPNHLDHQYTDLTAVAALRRGQMGLKFTLLTAYIYIYIYTQNDTYIYTQNDTYIYIVKMIYIL